MSEPLSLSSYKKPVQLSKLPVRDMLQPRTLNTRSLSERIPRSSSQDADYKRYIAKQMVVPEEVTNENSQQRSTNSLRLTSNMTTLRERATSSGQKDATRSTQVTDNVKSTLIKLYMGSKIPVQKIPPTKRGFNIMKFSYDGREGLKIKQEKKGTRGKHVSELFRPLNKTVNSNVSWRASPALDSQAINVNDNNNDQVEIPEKQEVITTKFSTTTGDYVLKMEEGEEQDWIPEENDEDIHEVINEPVVVPAIRKQEVMTEQRKTSEPTLVSQFPTHTNQSLGVLKSGETPEKVKYVTFTKEDERERITELEYSLTQPLKTSIRKDTFPMGSQDGESRKSKSRSPRNEDKEEKEFLNRNPYLKKIPDEQFDELTAKPFNSKRSIKKTDSQTLSKSSGLYESKKVSQEENYALPANLITEDDGKGKSSVGIGTQKSETNSEPKKSGNTSSRLETLKKSEESELGQSNSIVDEKYPIKKVSNQELSRLINSVGVRYGLKAREGETIKIEDEYNLKEN